MRLVKHFPLLMATTLGFATLLPPAGSILCPSIAHGSEIQFGSNGASGSSGRSGRSGAPGADQTISADGSNVSLNLFGGDGGDGGDGRNGLDAFCSNFVRRDRDVRGANGGTGGSGGDGGDGGKGGSLIVYYNNLADVQRIFVRSEGGRGGRGGRGGEGGRGCICPRRSWEERECRGTPGSPDYRCVNRRYYCTDGRQGSPGRDGRDGRAGSQGTLTLINRTTPLPGDQPEVTAPLGTLQSGPIALSLNVWNTRRGAATLLAPGSVIADEYREFVQRVERQFKLVWTNPQAASYTEPVTLKLDQTGQVQVGFPEDLWIDGTVTLQDPLVTYTVTNVLRRQDATRLAVADVAQANRDLSLVVVDLASKSDLVTTQFALRYRTRSGGRFDGFGDYETRFQGPVPPELVSRNFNRFTLNLGKLPLSSEHLRPGMEVELELIATRSFAGRSAQQKITWQGKIRKPL